ncbi:hypothetical protein Leryth_023303 [Lithospermum erythrorhizon]|nr:hypothetical protein Leryth_023303 [Lithospermum erythrorhizon]
MSSWFLGFLGKVDSMLEAPSQTRDINHLIVQPKWIPFQSNLAYRKYQVNRFRTTLGKFSRIRDTYRLGMVVKGYDLLILRYCPEFDSVWLELLENLHHPKLVVPLDFMPPPLVEQNEDDLNNVNWVLIKDFLDKQNKGSVVYVSFGSEAALSQEELNELALELKKSGLPFCWILRKPPGSGESESIELPDGSEENTKDQGIVWKSWAPQSHDSIGGFSTHCGWSYVIEGLSFGKPLIMLPVAMDLLSIVLESKKVGVEVARNEEIYILRGRWRE